MAKEIVWTETAVLDRFRIYQFWLLHNQSHSYSEKLETLFNESAKLIAEYPEIGTPGTARSCRIVSPDSYRGQDGAFNKLFKTGTSRIR